MEHNPDQLILRILERLAAKPGYSATVSVAEFHLFEELKASGFIVGQIGPDTQDAPPTTIEEAKLTATGRQHMLELKQLFIRHAPDSIESPVANSVLTSYAAEILAHCYTGSELLRATTAWALDCDVEDLPFATSPLPTPTTKREALEKNLVAFPPSDRFRVIEDLASKVRPENAPRIGNLLARLQAARHSKPAGPASSTSRPITPAAGPSDLFPASISAFTRELLDSIWDHYCARREWPTTWSIHSRFEKSRVMSAREELKGDHLLENSSSQGTIYELRICGVLLTRHGLQAEQLLVRYVDYLRRRYKDAPNDRTVTSADVRD